MIFYFSFYFQIWYYILVQCILIFVFLTGDVRCLSSFLYFATPFCRFSDTEQYKSQSYEALAPLMLPELSKLSEIIIEGDATDHRYWPVRYVSYELSHDYNMNECKPQFMHDLYSTKPSNNLYILSTKFSISIGDVYHKQSSFFIYSFHKRPCVAFVTWSICCVGK